MNKKDKNHKKVCIIIGFILGKTIPFVMVPFYSAWLTVREYGQFDLVVTYVTLFAPLMSFAIEEAVFRFAIDNDIEEQKKIVTSGLIVPALNSVIVFILVAFIYAWSCKIIIVVTFLYSLGMLWFNYFQGIIRFRKALELYFLNGALMAVFVGTFSIFFVYLRKMDLIGLILGHAIGYHVANLVIFCFCKFKELISTKEISKTLTLKMLKYSMPLVFNNISWWIINVSDRTIINVFLGGDNNGIYAIACKIPSVLTTAFPLMSVIWQEKFVTDKTKPEKIAAKYLYSVMDMVIPIMFTITFAGRFIYIYVLDEKYLLGYPIMLVLIFATLFQLISSLLGAIQISMMNTKVNGSSTIIGAFVNVVINIILIRTFGLIAAAFSTMVAYAVVATMRARNLEDIYGSISHKIWKNVMALIIAIVLCICAESIIIHVLGLLVGVVWIGIKILEYSQKKI